MLADGERTRRHLRRRRSLLRDLRLRRLRRRFARCWSRSRFRACDSEPLFAVASVRDDVGVLWVRGGFLCDFFRAAVPSAAAVERDTRHSQLSPADASVRGFRGGVLGDFSRAAASAVAERVAGAVEPLAAGCAAVVGVLTAVVVAVAAVSERSTRIGESSAAGGAGGVSDLM